MPSPLGHSLIGLSGYPQLSKWLSPYPPLLWVGLFVVVANLPDVDILPGLLMGNPALYHRQATHSVAAAVAIGTLAALLVRRQGPPNYRIGVWMALLYGSHLLLDMLVADDAAPYGIQLLWPLSSRYFMSPISLFPGFQYFEPDLGFMRSVFSLTNLKVAIREVLILLPLVIVSSLRYRRPRRHPPRV